jgi:PAS domain S-box-containing protein
VLCRGWRADGDGGQSAVLVALLAEECPPPAALNRLAHEFELKDALDAAWAVRPLALSRQRGRTALLLEDPGGEPLERLIGAPMETGLFLRLAIGIVAALGKAHQRGFVHKDVKPANILANCPDGGTRLTGFGIASRLPRERQAPEPPEVIAGTLAYMAPEQTGRMNRSIDSRSDLYALGVMFYQMVTGRLPFSATDPMEWIHCHIARRPAAPAESLKSVLVPISEIVMKLLAKTAEDRYQTAAGVEHDLRRCLAEWERHGRVEHFALGERDRPDRLMIPEKPYGREREVESLLAAFNRVVESGAPELVLVSGYSGIGKSTVVNELRKALVPPRGIFASGKFDQLTRDIPYSTFAQAFESLVRSLLGKSDAELAGWRHALLEALGPNGRLITDVIPELKFIIGDPPPGPELEPQLTKARFKLVFRRFIGVFARPEHPLALVLDDLQWLDAATLDLLEDLLSRPEAAPSDLQHLLLVGVYRDNEVTAAHPLMRKLDAIRTAGGNVTQITLGPLRPEHFGQLIADALRSQSERAALLAKLVHEKTGGNPLFAIQFISSLAEDGLLSFDHDAADWTWDLKRIRAKGYSDNVAELMVGKLSRLPPETQDALQLLACLGNIAEITTLSIVLGTTDEQVHAALWPSVRQELLERSANVYRFAHDRVREAAYSLMPDVQRSAAHLRIGRLLAAHTPPEKREEAIFDIVSHLNRGAALIATRDEREQLAELNLIAGKRAQASTAYVSALTYYTVGAALLPEDTWDRRHELTFELEVYRSECEFLIGELRDAEERLALLSHRATNTVERAAVACLRVELYTTLDQGSRAIEVGLDYLRHQGICWSSHPTEEEARSEYQRIWTQLGNRTIEALIDLPLMTDPASLATLDVLTKLMAPANFTDANLYSLIVYRAVNLSITGGNSDASCTHYQTLGMIAGARFGEYEAGFRLGQLGCALVERYGLKRFEARTLLLFGAHLVPWTQHVLGGRSAIRRSFDLANKSGDLTFATYSCANLNTSHLAAGDRLVEVQREAENGLEFARKARFGYGADQITAQLGLVRTLRGLTPKFGSFDDQEFDEVRNELRFSNNPDLAPAECWYWIRKMQARFFAGDHAAALDASSRARRLLWTTDQCFEAAEYYFYGAMSCAAACYCATDDERQQHLEALATHHEHLRVWAERCPENFENRAALVGAEIARIEGRVLDAMDLYERAIRSARANGFIHNEAVAYEVAARFYASRGFEEIAHLYLRNARQCYLLWGADGKVRQLEALHPHLREQEQTRTPTSTIGESVEQLDLATVIKVSEVLSGEMILERLIFKLMRTAMQHAGAARGLLIVPRGGDLQVDAEATTGGDDVTVHLRDDAETEAALPESVVRSVVRTKESVILGDASVQNPFSSDPYIVRHRARSVLCVPVSSRGKLIGVLYLENNLVPHVFVPARVAALKVLASQAAMSLENSRLYRDLAKREAKIRQVVDANVVGIQVWDLDGTILEANDAFLRMVGYEREDLVSGRLRWTDLTPAHWLGRDRQEIVAEIQRTGRVQPFEWEYFRKDGSRVPVLAGAAKLEGESQGVGFVLDLTERKRVEQALRESEAYLAEAQWLAHVGSWVYDHIRGKVKYYSDETFRLFGLDPRRPSGPPQLEESRQLIHPGDRERVFERLAQIFRDKAEYDQQYRIVLPDGTVRHLHSIGHPVLNKAGEVVEYFGTVMDVTERRHAEHRLLVQHRVARILAEAATAEEAIAKILEMMGEWPGWDLGAVWQNDRHAGVLRCAELWRTPSLEAAQFEAVTRTSTFSPGSGLPGRVWASGAPAYIPDVTRDTNFPRAEIAAREGLHGAFAFPILLGREVLGVIEFFSRDVWQRDDDLLVVMGTIGSQIGQFIERKRAENALQLAQAELAHVTRVVTLGELTASIAHEVNQPLGAIVTSAGACERWLAAEPPQMEKARRALERIVNDGRRAGEVIKRIRALMKRQAPQKEWLQINEAIIEVIAIAQHQLRRNDILLGTQLAEGLPLVRGDRVQLQQVLLNLIVNAIEAMSGIDERRCELTIVSAADGPAAVAVEVRDSGMGLDPERAAHLFEPFYTTKAEGLGIGLSISRSIVEAHGGHLLAAANVPHGAVFRFSVPLEEPAA